VLEDKVLIVKQCFLSFRVWYPRVTVIQLRMKT